ncbi:MAG TPA: hypothetical protein VHQ65_00630 [Thermoanaerobaculia bacterium]|nr:hypothetical protein [Thermoanaerobaculia bacterium]
MSPNQRQKVLLALLAVTAAVAAWVYVWPWLTAEPAASIRDRAGARGTAGGQVAEVRLDALTAEPRDYEPGRNPFSYGEPPKPPGPTPEELERQRAEAEARARAAEERRRAEQIAREAELESAAPPEPPRPRPPAFTLTYLGSFGPAGRRIAVFTDGEDIYNAVQGEVLAGQFVVADIGYESVGIQYVNFPDEPVLRVAIGS